MMYYITGVIHVYVYFMVLVILMKLTNGAKHSLKQELLNL